MNLAWSLCNLSCFQQLPNQGQLKSHSGRREQKRFPTGCIGRPSAPALCNSRLHGGSGTALTFLINFLLADHSHTQSHLFCISCLILVTICLKPATYTLSWKPLSFRASSATSARTGFLQSPAESSKTRHPRARLIATLMSLGPV